MAKIVAVVSMMIRRLMFIAESLKCGRPWPVSCYVLGLLVVTCVIGNSLLL